MTEIGFRALVGRYERGADRLIAASGSVRAEGRTHVIDVRSRGLDVERYEILLSNDPWKNYKTGPLLRPAGEWKGETFIIDARYYATLPQGSYPVNVRVIEWSGVSYDFFGGILYR